MRAVRCTREELSKKVEVLSTVSKAVLTFTLLRKLVCLLSARPGREGRKAGSRAGSRVPRLRQDTGTSQVTT